MGFVMHAAARILFTAMSLLVFMIVPAGAGAAPSKLIKPGVGAAGASLGMSRAQVIARLGRPVSENRLPDGSVVVMSYSKSDIVDVYFDPAARRVRMIIVSAPGFCTKAGECLRRVGHLTRLKRRYGPGLLRFVDWDGSVTYRRLVSVGDRKVMTEFTPNEKRRAVVQVMILYWDGSITKSGLGGG